MQEPLVHGFATKKIYQISIDGVLVDTCNIPAVMSIYVCIKS